MAISTAKTYLKYSNPAGEPSVAEILCPIIDYPDLGSEPSKLDTTDLSAEKFKTSILGLQDLDSLKFTANYDKEVYTKINGLNGKKLNWELCFGNEEGIDGKSTWSGSIVAYITGGGVDEVRKMTLTISTETEIAFA